MKKDFRLGILFVHGIGTQRSGETLLKWGESIIKTMQNAIEGIEVHVGETPPTSSEKLENAETIVHINKKGLDEERWLLTEGWWANAFLAPSYMELVSWSIRAIPWAVTLYIAQQYWQRKNGNYSKFISLAKAIVLLLFALILSPVFVAFLTLTLILGLLPIPQLRSFFLYAQGTIVGNVGDSLAFVESPIRAASIRTKILKNLVYLKDRCDYTIVVAHSQGAAIALDALGAIPEIVPSGNQKGSLFYPNKSIIVPDTLVTFGAGTNQLTSLKVLSAQVPGSMKNNPAWLAILYLTFVSLASIWMYFNSNLQELLKSVALITGATLILYFINFLANKFLPLKIAQVILVLVMLAMIVPMFIFSELNIPIIPVFFILLFLISIFLYMYNLLSRKFEAALTIVRKPPELSRWVDIYASADPIPNGPTRALDNKPESIKICLLNSILFDHTTYWKNIQGFTLRILKICSETARSEWSNEIQNVPAQFDDLTAWRARWLKYANYIVVFTCVLVSFKLWKFNTTAIPDHLNVPINIPDTFMPFTKMVIWCLFTLMMIYLISTILRQIWLLLIIKEHKKILNKQTQEKSNFRDIQIISILVWLLLFFGILIFADRIDFITEMFTSFLGFGVLIWAIGLGEITKRFILKTHPQPEIRKMVDWKL